MTALDQPTCVVELDGRLTVAPFPVTELSATDSGTRIEMREPIGLAARTTEMTLSGKDERAAGTTVQKPAAAPPVSSDGVLLWARPLLLGAELVAMFDTADGHALVRVSSPHHGHVDLIVGEVLSDDQVHASVEPDATGLGRITQVDETDDEIALSGDFGRVRMQSRPLAVFADRWRGTVADDAELGRSEVPAEKLAAAILEHGDIQVTVTRVPVERTPTRVVLCARGDHAVSVRSDLGDGASTADVVIFHSADLAMRTLELAGLLRGPLHPVAPPGEADVTGHVTVSIARRTTDGVVVGGVERWLECGASGWIQLLVDQSSDSAAPAGDEPTSNPAPGGASNAHRLIRTPHAVIDVIALLNEHATPEETQ